jgi:hypothetical protein
VGPLKGVGRIDPHTFLDTYAKVGFAKLYTDKTPVPAADLLNDRVLPFVAEHGIPVSRLLPDRGTEYCGTPDRHPFELYLALLDEFYRVAFRRKFDEDLESRQTDLDAFVDDDNQRRPHQGRWCYGKPPMRRFATAWRWRRRSWIA